MRRGLGALGRANDIENCLGMPGDDSEKDSCAALRLPAALLPIPQRTRADAHERRKSRLTQSIPLTNCPNVRLPDLERARRLATTSKDRPSFPYALPKLLEKIVLHRYSVSTICRKALFWAAVKSARSFFENAKSIKSRFDAACQK